MHMKQVMKKKEKKKACLIPYADNKGADQPAHLRILIRSVFHEGVYDII